MERIDEAVRKEREKRTGLFSRFGRKSDTGFARTFFDDAGGNFRRFEMKLFAGVREILFPSDSEKSAPVAVDGLFHESVLSKRVKIHSFIPPRPSGFRSFKHQSAILGGGLVFYLKLRTDFQQGKCKKSTRQGRLQPALCPRPESNRYDRIDRKILSLVRLPVPPLGPRFSNPPARRWGILAKAAVSFPGSTDWCPTHGRSRRKLG